MNKVKFIIAPGGGIKMEVVDHIGEGCTDVTKELEVSLQRTAKQTDAGKKPEYYENEGSLAIFNTLN